MKNNWKQILVIGLIIFSLIGVIYYDNDKEEPQKVMSKKEIEENKYILVDAELDNNQEKITLLSFIKNTPKDSINIVIREYLMETEYDVDFEKSIEKVAKKYSISSKKVASIVFSYKYEMLTKEDITDEFIETESNYQQSTSGPDGYSDRY